MLAEPVIAKTTGHPARRERVAATNKTGTAELAIRPCPKVVPRDERAVVMVADKPRTSSELAETSTHPGDQANQPTGTNGERRRAPAGTRANKSDQQQAGDQAKQRQRRPLRVIDEREPPYGKVYRWLFERFGRKLGPTCIALYTALASYANHEDLSCFPYQDTLARDIGVDRTTVIRAMKKLIKAGLVVKGQHLNKRGKIIGNAYALRRPPDLPATTERLESGEGCCFMPHDMLHGATRRVAPCNTTCGSVQPGSYEQIQEQNQEVCVGAHTHVSPPSPTPEIDHLTRVWMDHLIGGSAKFKREQEEEFRDFAAALLREGYPAEHLELSIRDRGKGSNEWPRKWAERVRAAGRPGERKADDRVERTRRQRAEAAAAEADRISPEDVAKIREEHARRKQQRGSRQ